MYFLSYKLVLYCQKTIRLAATFVSFTLFTWTYANPILQLLIEYGALQRINLSIPRLPERLRYQNSGFTLDDVCSNTIFNYTNERKEHLGNGSHFIMKP